MDGAQPQETKTCPMCGEKILVAAIKCKHCGTHLVRAARLAKFSAFAKKPMVRVIAVGLLLVVALASWQAEAIDRAVYSFRLSRAVGETETWCVKQVREFGIDTENLERLCENARKRVERDIPPAFKSEWGVSTPNMPGVSVGGEWHSIKELRNAIEYHSRGQALRLAQRHYCRTLGPQPWGQSTLVGASEVLSARCLRAYEAF